MAAGIGFVLVLAACLHLRNSADRPTPSGPDAAVRPDSSMPTSMLTPMPSTSSTPKPQKDELAVLPALPTRLDIPTISVHAEVGTVSVTQTSTGQATLAPPESTWDDLSRAYWWDERSAPSNPSSGTTFIIGHTCHSEGCSSVFNRLQEIQQGALVRVATSKGVFTYRVFKRQSYLKSEITNVDDVYRDVPNRLVLVTCKLRADGAAQTDNFVAWATLESIEPS